MYHYASTCEYQIKSLVEWQPAHRCAIVGTDTLAHFRDLSLSNAASEQDQELLSTWRAQHNGTRTWISPLRYRVREAGYQSKGVEHQRDEPNL